MPLNYNPKNYENGAFTIMYISALFKNKLLNSVMLLSTEDTLVNRTDKISTPMEDALQRKGRENLFNKWTNKIFLGIDKCCEENKTVMEKVTLFF